MGRRISWTVESFHGFCPAESGGKAMNGRMIEAKSGCLMMSLWLFLVMLEGFIIE